MQISHTLPITNVPSHTSGKTYELYKLMGAGNEKYKTKRQIKDQGSLLNSIKKHYYLNPHAEFQVTP